MKYIDKIQQEIKENPMLNISKYMLILIKWIAIIYAVILYIQFVKGGGYQKQIMLGSNYIYEESYIYEIYWNSVVAKISIYALVILFVLINIGSGSEKLKRINMIIYSICALYLSFIWEVGKLPIDATFLGIPCRIFQPYGDVLIMLAKISAVVFIVVIIISIMKLLKDDIVKNIALLWIENVKIIVLYCVVFLALLGYVYFAIVGIVLTVVCVKRGIRLQCLDCKKLWAGKKVAVYEVDSDNISILKKVQNEDSYGNKLGTVTPQYVAGKRVRYRREYKCKYCGCEWYNHYTKDYEMTV